MSYATCELATAVALGRNHLRDLGPGEGLLPHGIPPKVRATTLCGRDLTGGWDLAMVDADEIARLATPRPGDGRVWPCPRCHDTWKNRPRQPDS